MTTSATNTSPAPRETEQPTRPKLQLTATQLVASALAAITATVAASYLGVAGTVLGAALASVLTVTGNAVYSHSLQRTGERVREVVPGASRLTRTTTTSAPAPRRVARTRGRWPVFVAACLGVFAGVLVVVTAVELVAGRPLSDVLRGRSGAGTTLVQDTGRSTPSPRVTVTVTPAVVTTTPTVTVTGSPVTTTTTPTATTTPAGTATPTTSPSATPSASPSVSDTGSTSAAP